MLIKIVGLIVLALILGGVQCWYLQKEYNRKKVMIFSGITTVFTIGLAMVLLYRYEQIYLEICKRVIIMMFLFTVALTDYKKMIIPNKLVLTGLILRIVVYGVEFFVRRDVLVEILKSDFIGLGIVLIFFLAGYFIVKNGVGMGDVKMVLLMSLYLGTQGVFGALFISLVVIFFLALYLLITKKKKKKDSIPFAPAVLVGTFLSILISGV